MTSDLAFVSRMMVLLVLVGAIIPGGCGTEVGNPKKPGTSKVADDFEGASYIIAASVSETTQAVAEDVSGTQVSLTSADEARFAATAGIARTCSEDGGKITLKDSGEVSYQDEATRKFGTVRRTVTGSESVSKVWTDAGDAVRCNSSSDGIKYRPALLQAAKLSIDFTRSRTAAIDLVRRGVTTPLQRKTLTTKGSRELSVTLGSSGGLTRVDRVLKTDVARNLVFVRANGESITLQSRVFSDQDKPLNTQVHYESGVWTKRIISSGKLISLQEGDSSVVLEYSGVEYSKAGGCTPVAGKISGSVYRDGETDPALTFDLTFNTDGGTIKYSDGREEDYVADRCPLDD